MSPRLLIVIVGIFLTLATFLLIKLSNVKHHKTYDWTLKLTRPVDYEIEITNVSYFKDNKEFFRSTSSDLGGWSGYLGGTVLHNKRKQPLPDSVQLKWNEFNTKNSYTARFVFPKQKIIDYWNQNYDLLIQKWGIDYPKSQIALKLGTAPGGLIVLWLSGLDTNTSSYAMEVDRFYAQIDEPTTEGQQVKQLITSELKQTRFGKASFFPFTNQNVVSIYIDYHNGETNSIKLKQEKSNSILRQVNTTRGWGLAKSIQLQWFDKDQNGFRSFYTVDFSSLSKYGNLESLRDHHLVYLLDTEDQEDAKWHQFSNPIILELKETKREKLR